MFYCFQQTGTQQTLLTAFQHQVQCQPQAIALCQFDETQDTSQLPLQMSYQQLDQQSNQLAHYLRQQVAIKDDTVIALCCPRSITAIMAMLAIFKSGATYVAIDPDFPPARIALILNELQPSLLVSEQACLGRLGDQANTAKRQQKTVLLDSAPYQSASKQALHIPANALAYISYTSGTTGRPKGVMIAHQSIYSALHAMYQESHLHANAVLINKTPLSFDVSFRETLLSICFGFKLVVAGHHAHQQPASLWQLLHRGQVTHINFVPSMLTIFLDYVQQEKLHQPLALEEIFVAGERFPADLAGKIRSCFPTVGITNLLGATEGTLAQFYYRVTQIDAPVLLGKPFAHSQAYVLDQDLQPVAAGEVGELHISGIGLAQGYFKQEALTQEKFIANPFSKGDTDQQTDRRLYKTGDLVRLLADGQLDYVGRNDFQVKIRGQRVELHEIEQALCTLPAIKQACVLLKEAGDLTHQYLQAYVVCDAHILASDTLDVSHIEQALAKQLPRYMIPAQYQRIQRMPLTNHGKLDRQALLQLNTPARHDLAVPSNDIESQLHNLWSAVLKQTVIGIDDHFFQLGGNSLLAVQLTHRICQHFQQSVQVADLFAAPTIRQLARLLTAEGATPLEQIPVFTGEKAPLSAAQAGLYFLESFQPIGHSYHLPLLLALRPRTDVAQFKRAILQLIARHLILRTRVQSDSKGQLYQEVLPTPGEISEHPYSEQQLTQDMQRPFDLSQDLPIRVVCYPPTAPDQPTRILLNIHHIAADGWSLDLVLQELQASYQLLHQPTARGQAAAQLPLVALQYRDFAHWQRQQHFTAKQQGWQQRLAGMQAFSLPTDYPRPAQIDPRGQTLTFTLPAKASNALRLLAQRQQCSLYTVLLAGFYTLLYKFTLQSDLVIGTPMLNRPSHQLQSVIGYFVNVVALRAQIDPKADMQTLIAQLKTVLQQAQADQDYPFEQLIKALAIPPDTSRSPLLQVLFSVQSFAHQKPMTDPDAAFDLCQAPLSAQQPMAKYELSCMLDDSQTAITGEITCATALFHRQRMAELQAHYVQILTLMGCPQQKQQPIGRYPMLSRADYQALTHAQ